MPDPSPTQFIPLRRPRWPRNLGAAQPNVAVASDIAARIAALSTVIASGVEGAGYGDKRTDFRSYNELRQILNDLEDQLEAAMGGGFRPRQVRMTTQADKGL